MPRTVQQRLPGVEDNRVVRGREASAPRDNNVDRLSAVTMRTAKASMGAAVKDAIGDGALKEFGDKGKLSKVISGEKVPEYLARIYQDVPARRRLGLALLKDDPQVRVRLVIECDFDETGCQEISGRGRR